MPVYIGPYILDKFLVLIVRWVILQNIFSSHATCRKKVYITCWYSSTCKYRLLPCESESDRGSSTGQNITSLESVTQIQGPELYCLHPPIQDLGLKGPQDRGCAVCRGWLVQPASNVLRDEEEGRKVQYTSFISVLAILCVDNESSFQATKPSH